MPIKRGILTKSTCKAASLSVSQLISCWSNRPSHRCMCMARGKRQAECTRQPFLLTVPRHLRTKFLDRVKFQQSRLNNTSALDHDPAPIYDGDNVYASCAEQLCIFRSQMNAEFLHENYVGQM